jgi:hypothetical protein
MAILKTVFDWKLDGKRPLEDRGVGRNIILEWILGTYGRKVWNGFIWLRIGTNEPSGSIKCKEFLD